MYRNLRRPPLDRAGLRRSLTAGESAPWTGLEVVDETGSTNVDLVECIGRAAYPDSLDRTVLLAEQQVAGRGRRDRTFTCAPQSQILVSAALRLPGIPSELLGWVPLLTGVAVAETLREVAEVDAGLKWPNDVLIGGEGSGGKVAGILTEMARPPVAGPGGGTAPMIVVGVGLNVSQTADELPVSTATSLTLVGAACTDRNTLVRALLRRLATRAHRWQGARGRSAELSEDYARLCGTIGREVRVLLPGGQERQGLAAGIDEQGRLLVEHAGRTTAVAAGDVVHLRPAGGVRRAGA